MQREGARRVGIGNEMSDVEEKRAPAAIIANAPLQSLTSLRFFAALAVVLYHSGSGFAAKAGVSPKFIQNMLDNGWLGVPFFFILSGFILTYAHADLTFDRVQLKRFFVARFARLYPVYLLALMISIPFAGHYDFATDWFQFFLLQSWFPGSGATDWNFVAWTLSVELLFYLVFPFAFVFIQRLSNRALLVGLSVTIGVLLLLWANMTPRLGEGQLGVFGLDLLVPIPFLRLPEFVYGIFLCNVLLRRTVTLDSFVTYISVFLILFLSGISTAPAIQAIVIVVFGALIVSLAAASKGNIVKNILDNKILIVLGGASYALYMLQYPIRKYLDAFVPSSYSLFARLLFSPTLVLISVSVFVYFEGPMRKWLRRAFEPGAASRIAVS
jgi:peptidoglycan/LPS O-acetylase OafA/YrhL